MELVAESNQRLITPSVKEHERDSRMKTRIVAALAILITSLVVWVVVPGASAQPPAADVELTVVTGTDGTENPLLVELFGPHSGTVPLWVIVMAEGAGDLGPGMTDTYTFTVPYDFCDLTRLHISKPASIPVGDDAWDIREFYIRIDGIEVAFDRVAYETFSPMTYDSWPANLEWSGTAQYQSACSGSGGITPLPTANPALRLTPLAPVQPVQPIQPVQPGQTQSQVQVQSTCPGFNLQSRLEVNGIGRVLPGLPNNLRAKPTAASQQVGQIPGGGAFTVLSGPQCSDEGILYWFVDYNGMQGWTGEGQGSDYWVEPTN